MREKGKANGLASICISFCGTSIAQFMRAIKACLSPKRHFILYKKKHHIVKYKLTIGISPVSGVNLTSHDTG